MNKESFCFDYKPINCLSDEEKRERLEAMLVLGGAGDALGYRNQIWEFNKDGPAIHNEIKKLGGISFLKVKKWKLSDDTIMHLATVDALLEFKNKKENKSRKDLCLSLANHYIKSFEDMEGRAPGNQTQMSIMQLRKLLPSGDFHIKYNPKGGGCGGAMRSMAIGAFYYKPEQLKDLISVSIEAGRLTHNCPTGYLGSLASSLLTSFAMQGLPVESWGKGLVEVLPEAWKYIEEEGFDVENNKKDWFYFENAWKSYLKKRGIESGVSNPQFPENFGVKERDQFYEKLSFSGWGGSSGHDAPMIAYDALLNCGKDWIKLAEGAIFHGGDNDSTGSIAGSIFGIINGFHGVPKNNYEGIEYEKKMKKQADELFEFLFGGK